MNQTAPKWNDYAAGSDDRLLRYSAAPGLARRTYFDQFILPRVSGTPQQVESVWADFNAKADAADTADERRAGAVQRLKAKTTAQPVPFADFIDSQLDDGSFTPEQYRDSPMVRGLVRSAYFEAVVLPRVGVGQNIGQVRAEFNKKANDLDRTAGRVTDDLMPDPAAQAERTGLPSLTPTNLNTAPSDGNLMRDIAKRAGRTVEAEEPGLLERAASWLVDAPALGAGGPARVARRNAPVQTQRRVQLQDIARECLVERLTRGGTKPEAIDVILNSPRGREIVRDTALSAAKEGAKLANAGDATWGKLYEDMGTSFNRTIIDTGRNFSYTLLALGLNTRDDAQKFYAAGEELLGQMPEQLDRGFWGQGVTDVAGMAPLLMAAGAGGMTVSAGAAALGLMGVGAVSAGAVGVGQATAQTGIFAADQIGRQYRYAIEEAGRPENLQTRALAVGMGTVHALIENLQFGTLKGTGRLATATEKAKNRLLKKGTVGRVGTDVGLATVESALQEGVQQAVEALHQELSDQKGIDWTRIGKDALQAVQQSVAPSLILSSLMGGAPQGAAALRLRQADAQVKAAAAEVANATAENRTAAETKLADWQRRSNALRSRLGLEDGPQTTTGGPLDAPAAEAPQAPVNTFQIDGQDVVPGLELQGPGGKVTVMEVTPDPETTEQVVVVKTAAGEEMVLGTAELAAGNYKPVQAAAAEPIPYERQVQFDTGDAGKATTSPVTGEAVAPTTTARPTTDKFSRSVTKGLPLVNGEPLRLRETLYRNGQPYRVFRMLSDEKGKVYAVEFEGIENPVTVKELSRFSRLTPPATEPVPFEKQTALDMSQKPAPKVETSPITGETVRADAAPPVTTREDRIKAKEPPVAETQAAPEPAPVVAAPVAAKKPKPRKPKAARKPAVEKPAAPAKAPEPEAAKPEPPKVEPAAEAPKVEAAPVEAEDDFTPADMGNTSLADPKPVVFSKFNIDPKRFQNREDKEGFSEDTAESVYQQALVEGGLGFLKADPIVWWTDPKNKKRYILEGHSRYEGARRYKEKSGKKDLPIPAIEFFGTEAQARTKALGSNFKRTNETPLDASKFVAELRAAKASKAEQERKAREVGKRDYLTILRLGQLARDGKAVTMLRAMDKAGDAERKQAASVAEWVGEARFRYTDLTDSHENEITDYLNDKYGDRIKNQADALAVITDAVNRHRGAVQTLIDPVSWESPINMASTETETVGDREFKRLLGDAKGELRDAEARRDKLTANRAKAIDDKRWQPSDEDLYRENFEKLTTARDEAWAAVRKLEESRPDFVQSIDERQIDLFAPPAPAKPKAPAEAAKSALSAGTYETAKPELVTLGRQIIAEGHKTLAPFTQRLKELLGEQFAKLKGKIKEIYDAAKEDAGFVRLPQLRKMAGDDNQRGALSKAARRVLTRDRGLGKPTADLKDQQNQEMRAVRKLLDIRGKDFRKALKVAYPKGYSMVELEKVHAALTDTQPLFQYQHLPPSLVPAVKKMRDTIDKLTTELIASGAAPEIEGILREHLGSYLTRSYRIFGDQKYLQEVLSAVSYIGGQGSGRHGADIAKKAIAAADYIRAAFTIPDAAGLAAMTWPDLLSLAAHRGIDVKGRTKAEVLQDLAGITQRTPSDEQIRGMLTDLLSKARKASSQAAFRTGRQQGQMDLSSMMRRKDIPEALRDLMGEHKDPLVNFYRSGLRISQQVAKWKFMNAVVAKGLADGTLYQKATTAPDPFNPGRLANFDVDLGDPDDPTTAPFKGIFATQEFADAMRRGFNTKDQPMWLRLMMGTGASVKVGKTALSIDTTIRNFMGNPYFALTQGHVRFWEIGKAMRISGASFSNSSGTLEQTVLDLVRLGVIGDTVFASEIADLMRDAAIKSDGFESFHANLIEAVLGGGKKGLNVAMDTYQMMDDIWKVYGYLHEVRRYDAVGKKKGWTKAQVQARAAEIIKATYPSYSQLPELVQWFRLNPFVAPFVSFPASVVRTHYMTAMIAAQELQDKDTAALGMIRIAGSLAAAGAFYGLKEAGQYLSGMDDDDDLAARKLLPPQDQDGNIVWLSDPRKSGSLNYINASYTVGGAYVLDAVMSVMRGADAGSMGTGFIEASKGLLDPWTNLDLVAQMLLELSSNTSGTTSSKIYNPADLLTTEGMANASSDVAEYLWTKSRPGVARTLDGYKKAWEGAVDLYGTEYTYGNAAAKTLGYNAVTRNINQATAGSLKFLKSMQANTIDGLVKDIKDNPTDDEIRESARDMERTRQVLWRKQYEVVQTAQRFGLSRKELRDVMSAAQMTKEAQQDLLSGRYRNWWTSGQFMEGTEKSIMIGRGGKKGAAELTRRRKVLEDYLKVLKKEDLGVLPEGVQRR